MKLREELGAAKVLRPTLTFYGKFEHVIVLVLTSLIAIVVAWAT